MTSFSVEQDIAAAPDRVWAILTDAPRLVGGGLGVTRIEGAIHPGARLKLWSEASPGRAFSLRVAVFEPPTRMTWQGGMPFGLFKGVRSFALEPIAEGTRFHMREVFSGLFAPLIVKSIPDLTPSFQRFALGLKTLAETRS